MIYENSYSPGDGEYYVERIEGDVGEVLTVLEFLSEGEDCGCECDCDGDYAISDDMIDYIKERMGHEVTTKMILKVLDYEREFLKEKD